MSLFGKLGSRFKLKRAVEAEERGDPAAALEAYREAVVEFDPKTRASILNKMGMLAYRLGDMKAARTYYEQANLLAPGQPSILMNLANTLHQLKDREAAEAAYRHALEASKDRPDVLYNYAVFAAETDPRRAVELVKRCLAAPATPETAEALPIQMPLAFLAHLAAQHNLVDEVEPYFEELERKPLVSLRPLLMNQHALMLTGAGRHERALEIYRKMLEAWPKSSEARFNAGMALVRLNRLEEALAEFRAADLPASHYGIGTVHELRGEIADAVREYRLCPDRATGGVDFAAPFIRHAREFVERFGAGWTS